MTATFTAKKAFLSTGVVLLGTAVVKLISLVKEMMVAFYFGVSADLDLFLLALSFLGILAGTLFGAVQSALVPVYLKLSEAREREAADTVVRQIAALLLLATTAVVVVYSLFRGPLVQLLNRFIATVNSSLLLEILLQLSLYLLLSAITHLLYGVLQAKRKFAWFSIAPGCIPIVTVIFLGLGLSESWGIQTLVAAITCGAAVEAALLIWIAQSDGERLIPRLSDLVSLLKIPKRPSPIRTVFQEAHYLFWGMIFASSILFVDYVVASWTAPGAVSLLSYAQRIPQFLIGSATTVIGAVALPYFAQHGGNNGAALRGTFWKWACALAVISSAVIGILFIFSDEIIFSLFQRGAFSADDTVRVSALQQIYFLSVPSYLPGILATRLLVGIGKSSSLTATGVISFSLNLVLNIVLVHHLGLIGIAWATVVVHLVVLLLLLGMVRRVV